VAEFVRALRALKVWAGDPSLEALHRRTGVATSTLSDAFNPQRRRMPALELVRLIVRACGAEPAQTAGWERAWRLLRERIDSTAAHPAPGAVGPAAVPGPQTWVPRQLPPDVYGFVGRAEALTALAAHPDRSPATIITGTAGVGKTALAVHWAHRLTERYPDGQLYLDLRGHSGDPAITPTEALSLLLQSLGVPAERIPVDLHLQLGLYRSVLAGRQVLVVLDNVIDAAQVRPLLPGGAQCHALITSRDALTGLVAREGAARLALDTLSSTESADLLATHLGPERVAAEPDAAAQLAGLCAHLPLALRISAANLAARPSQSIAGTVQELAGTDRLGQLRVVGDPESAVAAAFDLSYRSLPGPARHLFIHLGLVPGPEIDRVAAAVLLDRDATDPVLEIDQLLAAHLLSEPSPGRYRMHDLLSLYARRHAAAQPEPVRAQALHRLLSWYLLTTDAAVRTMFSGPPFTDYDELDLTGAAQSFSGPVDAGAWLDAELPNLVMAVTHAADHGPAAFAWYLARGLRGYLHIRASGVHQLAVARTALRAAETADDLTGQAMCHLSLGLAAVSLGDLRAAFEEFETSWKLSDRINYTRGIEVACGNLGDICVRLGDISQAEHYIRQLLQVQPEMTVNKALNLANLATVCTIRGEHLEALRLRSECLAYLEQAGITGLITVARRGLAMTQLARGDLAAAEALLRQARAVAVEVGSDIDVFDILAGLVLVCVRTGRTGEALDWAAPLQELLDRGVTSYAGDDWAHAAILEAQLAAGRLDEAIAIGEPALKEYDRAGHRLTAMRVRIRLGRIHAARGERETALQHWKAALPYTIEQSLPERPVIEELLSGPV
jgi:tetratricopeptide (TPR) repeat protein